MTKCIICGAKQAHKPYCPTNKIFVSEIDNIDLMLNNEVRNKMMEYEYNIEKYGVACDSKGYK